MKRAKFKPSQKFTSVHRVPKYCHQCSFELALTFIKEEGQERLLCAQCGYISYLNPLLVAGTIPEKDGKIMLLRRGIEPMKHFWTFPAGFVEMGETVTAGAIRETWEEVGMKVKLTGIVGIYSYPKYGVATIVYEAKITGGKPTTCLETEEIQYFEPRNIPWKELAFMSTKDALRDWVESR